MAYAMGLKHFQMMIRAKSYLSGRTNVDHCAKIGHFICAVVKLDYKEHACLDGRKYLVARKGTGIECRSLNHTHRNICLHN